MCSNGQLRTFRGAVYEIKWNSKPTAMDDGFVCSVSRTQKSGKLEDDWRTDPGGDDVVSREGQRQEQEGGACDHSECTDERVGARGQRTQLAGSQSPDCNAGETRQARDDAEDQAHSARENYTRHASATDFNCKQQDG